MLFKGSYCGQTSLDKYLFKVDNQFSSVHPFGTYTKFFEQINI